MTEMQKKYYDKRGAILVKNLKSRHFDAYYCATKEEALEQALSLIPVGSSVGWGGCMSCQQIGLLDAVRAAEYRAIDRDACKTLEEREEAMRQCLLADTFLTGANALSMDGQMVKIDDEFSNGADWPGDDALGPDGTCGCNCTTEIIIRRS